MNANGALRCCDAIGRGVPFLGICLGLQALYGGSDEAPDLAGLQLLPGPGERAAARGQAAAYGLESPGYEKKVSVARRDRR